LCHINEIIPRIELVDLMLYGYVRTQLGSITNKFDVYFFATNSRTNQIKRTCCNSADKIKIGPQHRRHKFYVGSTEHEKTQASNTEYRFYVG